MADAKEIRILGDAFEWRIRSTDDEVSLSRNLYFIAHYRKSTPASIKVLQEGIKIMLQEIADYFGLTIEELFGPKGGVVFG